MRQLIFYGMYSSSEGPSSDGISLNLTDSILDVFGILAGYISGLNCLEVPPGARARPWKC